MRDKWKTNKEFYKVKINVFIKYTCFVKLNNLRIS